MVEVAAVLLAAGRATRWTASGGAEKSKLLAVYRGAPLVRRAAEAACASRARPVVTVTGHEGAAVRAALSGLDMRFVDNPDFANGLSTSLTAGLRAAPASCAGVVILLGDMPEVTGALIDRLIDAFAADPTLDAVTPMTEGARGNPVLLSRGLAQEALRLEGDHGARRLIERARMRVGVVEAGLEAQLDVDDRAGFEAAIGVVRER
jgi:molybdenum cofactor cytidylyltransferase